MGTSAVGRSLPGGRKSSPRSLPRLGGDSGRDGAATLRVPVEINRRGPQGKVTVESIVAGHSRERVRNARQQNL